ncbi:MAG TPA: hypothetical protein VGC93_02500 [Thermoanaerobaculia bacterium]
MPRLASVAILTGCLLVAPAGRAAGAAATDGSPTRAGIAFTEGLWAYAAGDYERAAERFREAAEQDPADHAVRDWLALARLRLEGRPEALPEIERREQALAAAQPEPIDRRPLWEGSLVAAAGVDSNPHLLSEELALPLPGDPRRLVAGSETDSVAALALRLGLHPFYRQEGWNFGLTLDAGNSFHQDFSELDLGHARAAVHLARGTDPDGSLSGPLGATRAPFGSDRWAVVLQAGASRYELGGETYLDTVEGAAAVAFRPNPVSLTQLELVWVERDFAAQELADPRRSGRDAALRLGQTFPFGGPGARRPRLRLTAKAADREAGREFDATAYEGGAELLWPLGLAWTAGLEAAARRDEFAHPQSNLFDPSGPARQDTTVRAGASLSWRAAARLQWTARVAWTDRDSNVDLGPGLPDLDYRRATASLGASWAF